MRPNVLASAVRDADLGGLRVQTLDEELRRFSSLEDLRLSAAEMPVLELRCLPPSIRCVNAYGSGIESVIWREELMEGLGGGITSLGEDAIGGRGQHGDGEGEVLGRLVHLGLGHNECIALPRDLPSRCPSLRSLDVGWCRLEDGAALIRLVAEHARLTHLEV